MNFREWLLSKHYSASTANKTASDLRNGLGRVDPDANVEAAFRRYLAYAAEHPHVADKQVVSFAQRLGLSAITRLPKEKAKGRKLEARSFERKDWSALTAVVAKCEQPEDEVIWAMATTAMRIGDALRVERAALQAGLKAGFLETTKKGGRVRPLPLGVPEPWQRLLEGMRRTKAPNVAAYVAEGDPNHVAGGAAYQRVYKRLRTLCRKLGLNGRSNPHRIRRTIAVRTLETTDNMTAVQQMLDHASPSSTMHYLDEVNLRKTRAMQRKMAGLPED